MVDSPYQWDTRADVVRRLAAAGCGDLLAQSTSCGGTRGTTLAHPHCGWCSQCVGRRFAVLAAGLEAHDPAGGYRVEVLTGDRTDGDRRVVLAAFLDAAQRVERVGSAAGLVAQFGEAARALRAGGEPAAAVADRVFRLYREHARDVARVLNEAAVRHIDQLRRRELPEGCTLRLVFDTAPAAPSVLPAEPPPTVSGGRATRRPPPRKRSGRAEKIERLVRELVEHLRAARDHAFATRDATGTPALLPRPSQTALARRAGLTKYDVTRCLQDTAARELQLYWGLAEDLDRIMTFTGRVGGGSAA